MAPTAARKPKTTGPAVFVWEGLDRGGTRIKGRIRAATLAWVRAELRRQGISPLRIRKKPPPLFGGIKKKIRSAEQAARAHGAPVALLIANRGKEEDELVLGAVTESVCDWFLVETKGWGNLLFGAQGDQARHAEPVRSIWQALPGRIRELLAPDADNPHTVLISGDDDYWSAFPWELLCFGDGPEDYLGLRCPLPRIGSILADHLRPYLLGTLANTGDHRMAIVAPHTTGPVPLAGVTREVEALQDLIPTAGGKLICAETGESVHDRLLRKAIEGRPSSTSADTGPSSITRSSSSSTKIPHPRTRGKTKPISVPTISGSWPRKAGASGCSTRRP